MKSSLHEILKIPKSVQKSKQLELCDVWTFVPENLGLLYFDPSSSTATTQQLRVTGGGGGGGGMSFGNTRTKNLATHASGQHEANRSGHTT